MQYWHVMYTKPNKETLVDSQLEDRGIETYFPYLRIERGYGSFVRCFSVPDSVDPEHVAAAYKNGVLTVTLPKKEIAKPRTIKVAVN